MKKLVLASLITASLAALGSTATAQSFTGLSGGNTLVQFTAPGVVSSTSTITGLSTGDSIIDIDYFTSGTTQSGAGQLFGMGSSGTLYTLVTTGGSTLATINAGPTYTPNPAGGGTSSIGTPTAIDFNPSANRLRVYSGTSNYRVTTGSGIANADGTLAYNTGDINFGVTPNLVAAAYTNNFQGSTATSLYSLDAGNNSLILNTGTPTFSGLMTLDLLTLNGVTLDIGANTGFDIQTVGGVNTAYLSDGNNLYTVNLNGGVAGGVAGDLTFLGTIAGAGITDIAVVPEPSTYVMLSLAGLGLLVWNKRPKLATVRS